VLKRDDLKEILGAKLDQLLFRNYHFWAIEKNKTLSKLTKIQINHLLDKMEVQNVKKGEAALKKGA